MTSDRNQSEPGGYLLFLLPFPPVSYAICILYLVCAHYAYMPYDSSTTSSMHSMHTTHTTLVLQLQLEYLLCDRSLLFLSFLLPVLRCARPTWSQGGLGTSRSCGAQVPAISAWHLTPVLSTFGSALNQHTDTLIERHMYRNVTGQVFSRYWIYRQHRSQLYGKGFGPSVSPRAEQSQGPNWKV